MTDLKVTDLTLVDHGDVNSECVVPYVDPANTTMDVSGTDLQISVPDLVSSGLGGQSVMWVVARAGSANVDTQGWSNNKRGTAAAVNPTSTNIATASRRIKYSTAASANSPAGSYHGTPVLWRGNVTDLGGFYYVCRFTFETLPAAHRWFVGVAAANAMTTAPGSMVDMIGVGYDTAADSEPNFMHNDSSGAATKSGTAYGQAAVSGILYEVKVWCKPNDTKIRMSFEDLGAVGFSLLTSYDSGSSTNLPSSTTFLDPQAFINTGAGTSVAAMGVNSIYCTSKF